MFSCIATLHLYCYNLQSIWSLLTCTMIIALIYQVMQNFTHSGFTPIWLFRLIFGTYSQWQYASHNFQGKGSDAKDTRGYHIQNVSLMQLRGSAIRSQDQLIFICPAKNRSLYYEYVYHILICDKIYCVAYWPMNLWCMRSIICSCSI